MENYSSYLELKDLEAYKLAREYTRLGWEIFEKMDWEKRKILGDQFIRSVDSIGANIAEDYGRFHFLDKIKFYYNARGSLLEAQHWNDLLKERKIIDENKYSTLNNLNKNILIKLNGLIRSPYNRKQS